MFTKLHDVHAIFRSYKFNFDGEFYIMRETYVNECIVNTEYFNKDMNPIADFDLLVRIEEFVQEYAE